MNAYAHIKHLGPPGLAVASGLLMGWSVVNAPILTWILLGGGAGLLMWQLPPYIWVGAAVLSATLSRFVVAVGIAPSMINFVHFPLTLGAVCIAAASRTPHRPVARSIAAGAMALFVLSFISWLFNGGEFLRPVLNWMVFLEPFFIIYALTGSSLHAHQRTGLWVLALGVAFLQLPLTIWQKLTVGALDPDFVQGTFIGLGAGHHVVGGVALLGTLVCTARGLSSAATMDRLLWLAAGAMLFIIPVLSDAKQNIAAFLPVLGLLLLTFHVRWTALIAAMPVIALTLFIAFTTYEPLQAITSSSSVAAWPPSQNPGDSHRCRSPL